MGSNTRSYCRLPSISDGGGMTWTNSSRQDLPSRSSRFISTSSTTTSPIVGHGVGKRWRKRSRISLNDKNHNIYNKKGKGLATRRSRGGRHTCYNGIYNSNNFSKIGSITNITNINNNNSCIKNINNITTGNINSNNRCCIRKKSNNNCSSGINNNNNNNNNNKSGSFVREHQRIRRVAAATRRVAESKERAARITARAIEVVEAAIIATSASRDSLNWEDVIERWAWTCVGLPCCLELLNR